MASTSELDDRVAKLERDKPMSSGYTLGKINDLQREIRAGLRIMQMGNEERDKRNKESIELLTRQMIRITNSIDQRLERIERHLEKIADNKQL